MREMMTDNPKMVVRIGLGLGLRTRTRARKLIKQINAVRISYLYTATTHTTSTTLYFNASL